MDYRTHKHCLLCGSSLLQEELRLESTPPANEFVKEDKPQDKFELYLSRCSLCGHVQLPVAVDPNRLFRNYVYVSGTSPVFVKHFEDYANYIIDRFNLKPNDLVVEIGSNDGTLLKFFQSQGIRVLGVDPASEISKKANSEGIKTIPDFFTRDLSREIKSEYGEAKVIIANNVFAHSADLTDILSGVKYLLDPDGSFIFEVSYLVDVIENMCFDTIYHEHNHYHHVDSLANFFDRNGMALYDVQRINTHGGSIRGFVKFGTSSSISDSVAKLAAYEDFLGLHNHFFQSSNLNRNTFSEFRAKIHNLGVELSSKIANIRSTGGVIYGFGAPAKATTLMHQFKLNRDDIPYVIDDSPWKQGLLTPGLHIPVVSSDILKSKPPTHLLILAWNFADSIIAKNDEFRKSGGKFLIPIPELKEIS